MLNVFQVFKIARVSKRIKVDNLIIRIVVYKQAHYMRPDKTGSAGNENMFGHKEDFKYVTSFPAAKKRNKSHENYDIERPGDFPPFLLPAFRCRLQKL